MKKHYGPWNSTDLHQKKAKIPTDRPNLRANPVVEMHIPMVTLTWSPYEIFLHFLLIWSKWVPKSQTCPSQVLAKIFYSPLKMMYIKNRKNPKILQKMINTPYCLCSLERKLFVDYKNVVGFCFGQ